MKHCAKVISSRVPLVGKLSFIGIEQAGKESDKGLKAGRTWDYRSYISGPDPRMPNRPKQYAVWSFDSLPAALSQATQSVPGRIYFRYFSHDDRRSRQGNLLHLCLRRWPV